jgi:hypothetical protein
MLIPPAVVRGFETSAKTTVEQRKRETHQETLALKNAHRLLAAVSACETRALPQRTGANGWLARATQDGGKLFHLKMLRARILEKCGSLLSCFDSVRALMVHRRVIRTRNARLGLVAKCSGLQTRVYGPLERYPDYKRACTIRRRVFRTTSVRLWFIPELSRGTFWKSCLDLTACRPVPSGDAPDSTERACEHNSEAGFRFEGPPLFRSSGR